jgi:beta-lactamase regulating signal transducer with metallopeptidase domain
MDSVMTEKRDKRTSRNQTRSEIKLANDQPIIQPTQPKTTNLLEKNKADKRKDYSVTDIANILLVIISLASLIVVFIMNRKQNDNSVKALSFTQRSINIQKDGLHHQIKMDSLSFLFQHRKDS